MPTFFFTLTLNRLLIASNIQYNLENKTFLHLPNLVAVGLIHAASTF